MMANVMQRCCLCILLLWCTGMLSVMSQEVDASVQQAKNLLEQLEAKVSQRPGWGGPASAIESGVSGLKKFPEFVQLQQETNVAWPQIVNNIQTVAPSEMSKAILFVAFQSLPPQEYLQFLDRTVDLAEAKVVDKQLLKWALFPTDKNVRGVLDFNYNQPVAVDILQKVRVLYATDQNMVSYCNATLSGKTKKEVETYLNANPREPRPTFMSEAQSGGGGGSSADPALKSSQQYPQVSPTPTVVAEKLASEPGFPIVPVVILIALIAGAAVFFLRRKS